MIRQGDVLLMPVLSLPRKFTRLNHQTIAFGEGMWHSHRFESGAVDVVFDSNFNQYCKVTEEAELLHEEHKNIKVPPGKYLIIEQRQLNMRGRVIDSDD
jgi:hypothetical protein